MGVELVHNDFETASVTQNTRSYINMAAQAIKLYSGTYRHFNGNRVYVYSDKKLTNELLNFASARNGNYPGYNSAAVNFNNIVLDADSRLYFKTNTKSEYASATALSMVNGDQINFSSEAPGQKTVTINTTNSLFSTTNRTYTNNDVTIEFSNILNTNYAYVTLGNGSYTTVSVSDGYHIAGITFTFRTNYYPETFAITSGGGSYSGTNTGTWTPANDNTKRVSFRNTKRTNYDTRLESFTVTLVEND